MSPLIVDRAVVDLRAGALASAKLAFAGDQLTIVSWAGPTGDPAESLFRAVHTTGIKITDDVYSGDIGRVRPMAESKTVSWA
ncbi:hypothetical protein [Bradyrhizobium sp. WSM1743]|uniref:hypothetical protein n=1 Tax=Bradyrhizobium sp. WSM1743 TaxID=318996 RepID=UPI0012EC3D91|nr:hypothetical protein [Bradyrhizobium sp. WSM1743]